jgi:hypothetical protein
MATTARGYLFEGNLYMQSIVGGVLGPVAGPLEGTRFSIQPSVERKNLLSRGRNRFGQVIESVGIPQETNFGITLAEGNPDVLALGLMGTLSTVTVASGTLTAESITAALGYWVPLTKQNLTGTVTVTNTGATVTYVEGTDYSVDRQLGWVKALEGGAITDASSIKVSGAYGAISAKRIQGATQTDLRARFTMNGRNMVDGNDCIVTVWEAIIAPDQAQDLLSGEFLTTSLTGTLKTPSGKNEPFLVDLRGN